MLTPSMLILTSLASKDETEVDALSSRASEEMMTIKSVPRTSGDSSISATGDAPPFIFRAEDYSIGRLSEETSEQLELVEDGRITPATEALKLTESEIQAQLSTPPRTRVERTSDPIVLGLLSDPELVAPKIVIARTSSSSSVLSNSSVLSGARAVSPNTIIAAASSSPLKNVESALPTDTATQPTTPSIQPNLASRVCYLLCYVDLRFFL
jgi:hypothetical protein